MGLVAEIGGDKFWHIVPNQVLPDDDDSHTGRSHVLLDAGPDQAILADIAGTGEEHGGLVRHQNFALGIRQCVVGGAVDGLVFADIDVIGVIGNVQIGAVGNVEEILVGRGGNNFHLAVPLGLGNGLFAPRTGLHIAGYAVFHQVHGHHGELHRAAALNEQDLIIFGNVHQRSQISFSLRQNILKHTGAVTHLHHAHAAAVIVQYLGGDLLQHRFRHHGRTGGKIVNAVILHRKSTFHPILYNMCRG